MDSELKNFVVEFLFGISALFLSVLFIFSTVLKIPCRILRALKIKGFEQ